MRLTQAQSRLLDIAAELVRPGGALIYAVCSLLSREGVGQIDAFLGRHSSWQAQDMLDGAGRCDGKGRLLTPAHDGTDGFFVARLTKPC
jgi:16S rRNA (cytosine967-C5)-methyltransferase